MILKETLDAGSTNSSTGDIKTPDIPAGVKSFSGVNTIIETKDKNILIADSSRTAGLYNQQGQKLKTYTSTNLIAGISLSPDEETVVIFDIRNNLNFYNAKTGALIGYSPKFGAKKIKNAIFNKDSTKLLILSQDNAIYVVRTEDILFSPETVAPTIKQFQVMYNQEDPNDRSSGQVTEFTVREIRATTNDEKTEYITSTKEKVNEKQNFELDEDKKKKTEVLIVKQPEQEYFPASEDNEKDKEITFSNKDNIQETRLTEYKIPNVTSKIPEVVEKKNEKIETDIQPKSYIEETVKEEIIEEKKVELPKKEKTIPKVQIKEPEQKVIVEEKTIQEQVIPQQQQQPAIVIRDQPVVIEQEQQPVIIQQEQKPNVTVAQQEPKTTTITEKIILTTEEYEDELEEKEPELTPKELAKAKKEEKAKEKAEKAEQKRKEKEEKKKKQEQEVEEEEELEEEPKPLKETLKEIHDYQEEEIQWKYKDGHSLIVDAGFAFLPTPYNFSISLPITYRNYDLIKPFYFGGTTEPYLGIAQEQFPFRYESKEGYYLSIPNLLGVKFYAPIGFAMYPFKNDFEVYGEINFGVSINSVWNGHFGANRIMSSPFTAFYSAIKVGAAWKFLNINLCGSYDAMFGINVNFEAGIILNLGGVRRFLQLQTEQAKM